MEFTVSQTLLIFIQNSYTDSVSLLSLRGIGEKSSSSITQNDGDDNWKKHRKMFSIYLGIYVYTH